MVAPFLVPQLHISSVLHLGQILVHLLTSCKYENDLKVGHLKTPWSANLIYNLMVKGLTSICLERQEHEQYSECVMNNSIVSFDETSQKLFVNTYQSTQPAKDSGIDSTKLDEAICCIL